MLHCRAPSPDGHCPMCSLILVVVWSSVCCLLPPLMVICVQPVELNLLQDTHSAASCPHQVVLWAA